MRNSNNKKTKLCHSFRWYLLGALASFSLLCAGDEVNFFELSLGELINTPISSTSYFEETLLSSAYSVKYSEETQWQKLGVRNIGELLNHLPSTIAPSALGRPRVVAIRGYFRASSLSGTAVRFDGVPMNKLRQSTGLFEIDGYELSTLQSIEVIRGPGSAIHGNDAFHGVISLQSLDRQTDKTTLYAGLESAEGGTAALTTTHSFGNQRITAALAARDLGDANIAYSYLDPLTNTTATGHRSEQRDNANALIKYQHQSNGSRFYLTSYYLEFSADELPGPGITLPGTSLKDKDWSFLQSNTALLKVGLERQLANDTELTAFAYYWDNDDELTIDGRYPDSPQPIELNEQREEDSCGLQLLFKHQFSADKHLALGYEYRQNRLNNVQIRVTDLFNVITSDTSTPESGFSRELNSLIVDGKHTFNTLETALVYGLRVDDYSDFSEHYSPRLGLIQSLNTQSQLKLIYNHAFRSPSAYEYFGSEFVAPNRDLEPEELDNIELAYQFYTQYWFHTITLFTSRWREAIDQVLIPPTPDGELARWENRGKSKAEGIELESSFRGDTFSFDAWASYVKSKEQDQSDDNAFPHVMLYIGLGYRLDRQWEIYLSNRYNRREKASVLGTSADARDYFRTDLSIQWQSDRHLKAGLAVRNLFDRDNYQPSIFDHLQGIPENSINASLFVKYSL